MVRWPRAGPGHPAWGASNDQVFKKLRQMPKKGCQKFWEMN